MHVSTISCLLKHKAHKAAANSQLDVTFNPRGHFQTLCCGGQPAKNADSFSCVRQQFKFRNLKGSLTRISEIPGKMMDSSFSKQKKMQPHPLILCIVFIVLPTV